MQAAWEDQQKRLAQQQARVTPAPPVKPQMSIEELLELLREREARRIARLEASASTTPRRWQK